MYIIQDVVAHHLFVDGQIVGLPKILKKHALKSYGDYTRR